VAGIWLGIVARREIAGTGERGAGLAIAGIIIGVITLLFATGCSWRSTSAATAAAAAKAADTDHRIFQDRDRLMRRQAPLAAARRRP
jgi:hypothetical protein